jgi:hypothetical protein
MTDKTTASLPRLAIILHGGLVQCVISDTPEAFGGVVVIDYDTEGCSEDELTDVPQGDGSGIATAVAHLDHVQKSAIGLDSVWHDLTKQSKT